MKWIDTIARGWPLALAATLSTPGGSALAQAPTVASPSTSATARPPLSVTVSAAQQQARPRGPALAPRDPALARVNQGSGSYPSPQGGYEPTSQVMPTTPSPTPGAAQGFSTTPIYPPPGYPQGYNPQPMGNFFLPVAPYGYMPPAQPYGYMPPPTAPYGYMPPAQPYGYMPPLAQPYGYMPPPAVPYGFNPPPGIPFGAGPPPGTPFGTNTGLNAITNQSISVPTSRATSRVRVRGPGMIGSGLAQLGERLIRFGRTRIETTQETDLETPLSQPSGGVATISSTGSMPLIQQQNFVTPPPGQTQGLPTAPQPSQGPTPSPQGGEQASHKHHWWK